jgi:hypothetical protein
LRSVCSEQEPEGGEEGKSVGPEASRERLMETEQEAEDMQEEREEVVKWEEEATVEERALALAWRRRR